MFFDDKLSDIILGIVLNIIGLILFIYSLIKTFGKNNQFYSILLTIGLFIIIFAVVEMIIAFILIIFD